MRITIAIDDDVLAAARPMAEQKRPLGEVISGLARSGLSAVGLQSARNGFPLLPLKNGGRPVTLKLVNALRDDV